MSHATEIPVWIGPGGPAAGVSAEQVGGKAAEIWRMGRLGLCVPPAFVLPAKLCAAVNADPAKGRDLIEPALRAGIERLEAATGRRLGDARAPLLVSVRSGAAVSMPGMLSTVLNIGLGPEAAHGLIRLRGDPRLAWDCYRRFLEGYATVVLEAPPGPFAQRLASLIRVEGVLDEAELDGEALERLCADYALLAASASGGIPDDPLDQLTAAALAVFASWDGHKAREYRRLNQLEHLAGTAVTVQAMVYGNAGRRSGAGVAFSRNPATGAPGLYLDFLFDAQGEDVVSGRRTPTDAQGLAERLPEAFAELKRGAALMEAERKDLQDIEFTVEEGRLYFLQARNAKRTPRAALRVAVDMVAEGLLRPAEGLARVAGVDLDQAGVAHFVEPAAAIAQAIPAAPGLACGRAAFSLERAQSLAKAGDPVILVRPDISTEDIEGLALAAGALTAVGGRTAHAAVVARELAKACLVGCETLVIEAAGHGARLGEDALREGDWLWLDGETGQVGLGRRTIARQPPKAELEAVATWKAGAPQSHERRPDPASA